MARLPAEWEEQDGVLIAWPHEDTDWRPWLTAVEPVFIQIIVQISRREAAVVVAPDIAYAAARLKAAGAAMDRITLCPMETNDTWSRDFGPITVMDGEKPLLLDFGFNGWGLKFAAHRDNRVSRRLHGEGIFGSNTLKTIGLVLEGGSIESDGRGSILTTAECLLNPNRNPHLTKAEIETALGELLGAEHFLWLENGYLAGDDTDSHIDTLARICPDDTIAHVRCDDPKDEHYQAICAMEGELARFRTRDGRPYRLLPLPWPEVKFDEDGVRLPATYANFLVINNAVLVPTYRDKNDAAALAVMTEAFPRHEIIPIDCLPLILQHGSLHCVTMQLPKGTLKQQKG
jgi:agmatine deiminase